MLGCGPRELHDLRASSDKHCDAANTRASLVYILALRRYLGRQDDSTTLVNPVTLDSWEYSQNGNCRSIEPHYQALAKENQIRS